MKQVPRMSHYLGLPQCWLNSSQFLPRFHWVHVQWNCKCLKGRLNSQPWFAGTPPFLSLGRTARGRNCRGSEEGKNKLFTKKRLKDVVFCPAHKKSRLGMATSPSRRDSRPSVTLTAKAVEEALAPWFFCAQHPELEAVWFLVFFVVVGCWCVLRNFRVECRSWQLLMVEDGWICLLGPGSGFGASDTACVDYGRDDSCSLCRAEESAKGRCCNKWWKVWVMVGESIKAVHRFGFFMKLMSDIILWSLCKSILLAKQQDVDPVLFAPRSCWEPDMTFSPIAPRAHTSITMATTAQSFSGKQTQRLVGLIALPNGRRRVFWDSLSVCCLVMELILLPLHVFRADWPCFSASSAEIFLHVFWHLDIVMTFLTGIYRRGELVLSPKRIAKNYAMGWLSFDLLYVAVNWATLTTSCSPQWSLTLRFCQLSLRLLRMCRVNKTMESMKSRLSSEKLIAESSILQITGVFGICETLELIDSIYAR